ncbi:MAG: biotin/lipoyl-containing protein [Bacteroidota bacterium]|nr:biotin/lipoyl-containing protein [Bacteroidota bacterium]
MKEVKAIIPGTILDVLVKKGDKVTFEQPVLILEAMKMNNRIQAEYVGTVKKIHVKVGERVPKNFVMMEIE